MALSLFDRSEDPDDRIATRRRAPALPRYLLAWLLLT